MKDQVFQFVIGVLNDMDYSTRGVDLDTTLGPSGVDMESLELAELGVRVEDRFAVRFVADEAEELASLTIGEFADLVTQRLQTAATQPARTAGES
jgi:acyl carrier protein